MKDFGTLNEKFSMCSMCGSVNHRTHDHRLLNNAAPIGYELAEIVLEVYQRTEAPDVKDFQRMVKKASEFIAKAEGKAT